MNLKNKLDEEYGIYKAHMENGATGSAFESLGEIQNIINNYEFENRYKYNWINIINLELKNFSDLKPIFEYLDGLVKKIRHISSIGTVFIEEEIICLLSDSISIEMITNVLVSKFDQDCIDYTLLVNKDIEEISTANQKAFNNSLNIIRKNSSLPVINYWISDYKI